MPTDDRPQTPPTVDAPIRIADDDRLARRDHAATFARWVLSLDSRQGLVVGVLGPWGSGKTSYINLMRSIIAEEKAEVLDFNPWLFSGADQLVSAFFTEVAAELKLRKPLVEIGAQLGDYGDALSALSWLPVAGPFAKVGGLVAKLAGAISARAKGGTSSKRDRLENALRRLARPIVVVIDDVDRLSTAEIRDVFKLVRLTASFPQVIYLVAFDRARVEQALSEDGLPGRDYLEKILQATVDLPVVSESVLDRQVFAALDSCRRSPILTQ